MKTLIGILMAATFLPAEEKSANKAPAGAPPAVLTPAPLPAGAALVEPNLYRFTDRQGKVWFYRKTPFGISRWEDQPAPQPVVEEKNPISVKDLGDAVQFERQTPFGVSKWVRKKGELSAEEQALLSREQGAAAREGK